MPEAVITGLGPVTPIGVGQKEFWEALKAGKSGIRLFSRFHNDQCVPQVAGEIPREWILKGDLPPQNGEAWCTSLVVTAGRKALEDAGISKEEFSRCSTGVRVGISTIDMEVGEREYDFFKLSGSTKSSVVNSSFPHASASELAREFKCSGKVLTFSSACSAGLVSIISAAESILKGEEEMILAGGGDAPLTPFLLACFSAAGLHPVDCEGDPVEASRPFDARRKGGVMAEGAGMILLESLERARNRRAKIYARVAGWGIANATSPLTAKSSFVSAILQALERARLPLDKVDYISAHAPGIKFTDKVEVEAIKEVFGRLAYNIPVSSIKSMIGNPLAAAGPLQVIATALALKNSYLPPTINYECPDPGLDLDFVPNKGRYARVKSALVNSFGIGGLIATLLLSKP